jgi:hypothetical protein
MLKLEFSINLVWLTSSLRVASSELVNKTSKKQLPGSLKN